MPLLSFHRQIRHCRPSGDVFDIFFVELCSLKASESLESARRATFADQPPKRRVLPSAPASCMPVSSSAEFEA